jgi:hypothetical protein
LDNSLIGKVKGFIFSENHKNSSCTFNLKITY